MSELERLLSLVRREVVRFVHRATRRTPVIVDSYDKKTHAVKLKLQPVTGGQDVITGWIPLHTLQTGNETGWHSPPNIGDHGWLDFHGDDREAGTFTHATFNDKFKPDKTVEAGELKYIHSTKSYVYFKKDGTVEVKDKDGKNSIIMNGKDTVTIKASKIVLDGTVYLGGADASKEVAMKGTTDSANESLTGNLSTKALTK